MTRPRVCVLRAPGTNCDVETAFAFEAAGALAECVHLFRLLEAPQRLAGFQVLCVPGGFSYGDDIGAGAVFGQKLQRRLAGAIGEFLQNDTLVLGICNGFQVLLKAGLLPDGTETWPPDGRQPRPATLTWNENGRYTALWVHLRVSSPENVFLRDIERLELPVAHAEGRLVVREAGVLDVWRRKRQVAVQFAPPKIATGECGSEGPDGLLPYPFNPNGSIANIAGLGDPTGRVLGLMPHPERFIHATQHPQWTRRNLQGEGDGLRLFRNAVAYFA